MRLSSKVSINQITLSYVIVLADLPMAPTPTSSVWLTDSLPTATNRAYNKQRSNLFDAAEKGNWNQVFVILQDAQKTYKESWVNCPTSADGWTPLHYAVELLFFLSFLVNRLLTCCRRTKEHRSTLSTNFSRWEPSVCPTSLACIQ